MLFKKYFSIVILLLNINEIYSYMRRLEYKHSFMRPLIIGPGEELFLWKKAGSAAVARDNVRLVPSMHGQKGLLWNKIPWDKQNFEIIASINIHGLGKLGADGMAIWYTPEFNDGALGETFGNVDHWKGLGIFLDSYDNDNKQHNEPHIAAMLNDGSVIFNQSTDGEGQILRSCASHFRNQPLPTILNISYIDRTLTVSHGIGATLQGTSMTECFSIPNIHLNPYGFFGLSAATGGLADDHDVHSFAVYSLVPETDQPQATQTVSPPETAENHEFKEFYKKLEQEKQKYHKEHPDRQHTGEQPWEGDEDWMDNYEGKDLRLILEGQTRIEGYITQLASTVNRALAGSMAAPGGQNVVPHIQEQSKQLQEIRNLFDGLNKQVANLKHSPPASYADGELKEQMHHLREAVVHASKKGRDCHPTKCITPFYFIIFMVLQISLFAGYLIYKTNSESKSKKLF